MARSPISALSSSISSSAWSLASKPASAPCWGQGRLQLGQSGVVVRAPLLNQGEDERCPDRPSSTPSAQQICDYVAQGHTREVAAQACGIVTTTLYADEAGTSAEDLRRVLPGIKRGGPRGGVGVLAADRAAQNSDWRAAAWMLERRYPEKWGRRRARRDESEGELTVRSKAYERLVASG